MNTNRLVLCVAAAGLLLSGCSSQSDSNAAESTSAATSTSIAATSSSAAPESLSALATSPPAATPEAAPSVVESTPPPVTLPVAPPANSPIDARSPDEIVANAGEKGQRYIAALRLAGIPPAGMDSAEILYADGTCKALADGMPRSEVLAEFNSVGEVYSQITPMSSQRIAEIYVDTAEQTYC
ncbi:dihydrofolate reductase [Rhodococcus erythropolis]|nr:dihydrofolate reductase [Rhodococcus erythropolis]